MACGTKENLNLFLVRFVLKNECVYVCTHVYLQHYEYLGGRLDHLVQTTDMLVAQVLHGLDLDLDPGQILLGSRDERQGN